MSENKFLPICKKDMEERGWEQLDFVYISGDAYVDHPSFGHAIITRLLEAHGFKVGIIAQPDWKDKNSITILGEPRLGFLVSAGNMDSMVNHYSVSKKHRRTDAYTPGGVMGKRPDYAAVVYSNLIRQVYKKTPIILGGIEASLRRLAHYDYWSDKLKRSILLDSGADLISYGMGEHSIIEIAEALDSGIAVSDITFIAGTVYKTKSLDSVYDGVEILMVFVSLSLVPLMYKPSSESHPFGYQQIESLFVVVKGAIMIAVTVGLIINNIQIIFHGGQHVNFSMVAYFEMSATLVSIAVIFLLRRMNSKLTSPIVIMEIQEWQIDSVASFGMCIAFFLPQIITGEWFQPLIPYLDPILAIILSLFMLPVPIKTVITGLRDLFLLPPEEETVQEIKDIVSPILATYGDTKLYYDILRTGRKLWISVYITMNRDMISISKFKSVQKEIIQALSKEYQDFYFELLPDIEYTGDTEVPEPVPDEEET